jgi:hypothetical protein
MNIYLMESLKEKCRQKQLIVDAVISYQDFRHCQHPHHR